MIDDKTIEQLRELGRKVKAIAPNLDGQVVFNCQEQLKEPKVTVTAVNVTKAKK